MSIDPQPSNTPKSRAQTIIIPDAGGSLMDLHYDPTNAASLQEESVASRGGLITKERDPVVQIFAMNDYVIYKTASGKRCPVTRSDAVKRLYAVCDQLFLNDGGTDKTEVTYDEWLVENTVKACARSAEMMGRPYAPGMIEKTLQRLKRAVKGTQDRK